MARGPERTAMADAVPQISPPSPEAQPAATPRIQLFSGLRIVSLCTLASRILGLVRDMGMASLFGNGAVMDAFSVAFRIPNLARQLFGEGALATAFLPVFIGKLEQSGRRSAFELASAVLTLLAVLLGSIVIVCEAALWAAAQWLDVSPRTHLLLGLTAVMLPYLLFICLAAQLGALLNSFGRFAWPALLPVVLNVFWILAIWCIAPLLATSAGQVYAISAAIVIAGIAQLAAPLPTLRRLGFRFRAIWISAAPEVTAISKAMLPIVLGLSITQINTVSDSLVAWVFSQPNPETQHMSLPGHPHYPLSAGTASALYFGQRIYQFPLGVFGVALGTVLFPLLARDAQSGDREGLRRNLALGLRLVIVIGVPASAGLMILARPLTALLFQHGAFSAEDARQTSGVIVGYAAGVWAYCGLLIVHRGYYAIGDRITPLRVGILAVILNLLLNLALIWPLGGPGLAYATAIAAAFQVTVVSALIQHRVGPLDWGSILRTLWKSLLATAAMAAACFIAFRFMPVGGSSLSARAVTLGVPLLASVAVYFAAAFGLGIAELQLLFRRDRASD